MQTIICMKWGTRYDYKYVNNLYESINKHTNEKTRLIYYTDNDKNIYNDIICKLYKIKIPSKFLIPWKTKCGRII